MDLSKHIMESMQHFPLSNTPPTHTHTLFSSQTLFSVPLFWHFSQCSHAMIHLSCRQAWCQVFSPACNQLSSLTLSRHDVVDRRTYCTPPRTHTHITQTQSLHGLLSLQLASVGWICSASALVIAVISILGWARPHIAPQAPSGPPPQTTTTIKHLVFTIFIRVEQERMGHKPESVPHLCGCASVSQSASVLGKKMEI